MKKSINKIEKIFKRWHEGKIGADYAMYSLEKELNKKGKKK
jgi:hypothetical protein